MQTSILQALALTMVGNASLRGWDVAGFWPDAALFRYSRTCDFRRLEGDADLEIASDPMAWFATLKGSSSGLRLHNAIRERGPGQSLPAPDRMLVGFVGGGPAWIIEAVGAKSSKLWQGHDRIGDAKDRERKIWLHTYLLQGETAAQEFSRASLKQTEATLTPILADIEALAVKIEAERFAAEFRRARRALEGNDDRALAPYADFTRWAEFGLEQRRLLQALLSAWVFGGMGSWNDTGPRADELKPDYERLSEALFQALCDGVCALANSSYAGASLK
jgi:hypothetical protein